MTPAAKSAVKPYLIFFKAEEGQEEAKARVFSSENACEKWAEIKMSSLVSTYFILKCHSEVVFSCRAEEIKFVHDYHNELIEARKFEKKMNLDEGKEIIVP